jgi:hypothetical protein
MFRHHYGAKLNELAVHGDISEATQAARAALNAGCPFAEVIRVLRDKGFHVTGDTQCFTVRALFDDIDPDDEALLMMLRRIGKP